MCDQKSVEGRRDGGGREERRMSGEEVLVPVKRAGACANVRRSSEASIRHPIDLSGNAAVSTFPQNILCIVLWAKALVPSDLKLLKSHCCYKGEDRQGGTFKFK